MRRPIGCKSPLIGLDARRSPKYAGPITPRPKVRRNGAPALYFVSWCDLLMYCSARRIHQLASLRIRYLLFWIVDLVRERDTFFSLLPEKIG